MKNIIQSLTDEYKKALPENWKNEKYKWQAIKWFQDHWNIDAEDFGEMFKTATEKTNNLLGSSRSHPRGMMLEFIAADSEAVRQMFAALYDEQRPLDERIRQFQDSCDSLKDKYNNGTWKNHYQNTNSISVYLWLKYPDKYYIYKYGAVKDVANALESNYKPKANGSVETMIDGFSFYDEICGIIQKDDELRSILDSLLDESCYSDPMLKTMTIDFGYFVSKYRDNDSINEQPVTYLSEIIAALEELGGTASQNDICQKVEERGNIPNIKNNPNWKGVVSNAITTHSRDSKAYVEGNEHLFYSVDGLGKGVWGLVNMKSDKIIDIDEDFDFFSVGNTWLLSWNPKKWHWNDLSDAIFMTKSGMAYYGSWNCLSSKVKIGDRIFLIKLGDQPRGIFATGYVISEPYEAENYDESKSSTLKYVDVIFTDIIDFENEEIISQDYLNEEFPEQCWSPQGSGISIKPEIAENLIDLWNNRNSEKDDVEEIYDEPKIFEINNETNSTNELKIEKYTKEDFLKDVYLSEQDYTTLTSLMEHKKNIILQGAPGVGKTFAAKRLAYAIMGEIDESRIEFIQFHQNYSYEDFIMGFRPKDDTFELTEGVFYRFCEKARKDSEKREHFFIIDEINRGNLSKIFGELLMLIEADKRENKGYSVTLAYRNEKFSVPENLYIIGMMNTADRSLAMIDYALRRRFSFFEIKPGFDSEGFKNYASGLQNDTFNSLITQIKLLNLDIVNDLGKGFCIGHSYFCDISAEDCTDERIRRIVDYDIMPTLYEYWFDSEDKAKNWKKKLYEAIGAEYDQR